jgi:hypothetical protein
MANLIQHIYFGRVPFFIPIVHINGSIIRGRVQVKRPKEIKVYADESQKL